MPSSIGPDLDQVSTEIFPAVAWEPVEASLEPQEAQLSIEQAPSHPTAEQRGTLNTEEPIPGEDPGSPGTLISEKFPCLRSWVPWP